MGRNTTRTGRRASSWRSKPRRAGKPKILLEPERLIAHLVGTPPPRARAEIILCRRVVGWNVDGGLGRVCCTLQWGGCCANSK
eukprot:scaffold155662_cov21-Tisochrysis_lutea.AAC.1